MSLSTRKRGSANSFMQQQEIYTAIASSSPVFLHSRKYLMGQVQLWSPTGLHHRQLSMLTYAALQCGLQRLPTLNFESMDALVTTKKEPISLIAAGMLAAAEADLGFSIALTPCSHNCVDPFKTHEQHRLISLPCSGLYSPAMVRTSFSSCTPCPPLLPCYKQPSFFGPAYFTGLTERQLRKLRIAQGTKRVTSSHWLVTNAIFMEKTSTTCSSRQNIRRVRLFSCPSCSEIRRRKCFECMELEGQSRVLIGGTSGYAPILCVSHEK
jgi:hypothetical protein